MTQHTHTLWGNHGPPHLYEQSFNRAVQAEHSSLNHTDWFRCGHMTRTGQLNGKHTQAFAEPIRGPAKDHQMVCFHEVDKLINETRECPGATLPSGLSD